MFKKIRLKRRNTNGSQSTIASGGSNINDESVETGSIHAGPISGYQVKNIKKDLPVRLHRAVWKNNEEKLARIMEEKDRKGYHKNSLLVVDKHKRTALHIAACGQNQRIVDLLLTRDGTTALVMQDNEGNTPLHKAVECNRFVIISRFASIRCSKDAANIKNNKGHTPLHIAAQLNDKVGGEKILEAGGFADHKDNDGNSPLALAVLNNSLEFVDLMKDEDATVDCTNEIGETPLMFAARSNNIVMVQKLLTFRMVNPDLKDDSNNSAINYAEQLKTKELLDEIYKWYHIENIPLPTTNDVTVRTDVGDKPFNQNDEETMSVSVQENTSDRVSVDTFSELDMDKIAKRNNFQELLLQSNMNDYYDPEEEELSDNNDVSKQQATPIVIEPIDSDNRAEVDMIVQLEDMDYGRTDEQQQNNNSVFKGITMYNNVDVFDGSISDISMSDNDIDEAFNKNISTTNQSIVTTTNITNPIQVISTNNTPLTTPVKFSVSNTTQEPIIAPVVKTTTGDNDILELLEEGWDSDTNEEHSINISNDIKKEKDDKEKNIPKKVMNDDVLELLQDGWDSSDDESITTREVPPRKVPSTPPREVPSTPPREVPIITRPSPHKQQQESDNDVVSKGKDDIQELLDQGWDSDTEQSDEEILSPIHNSTPITGKPLMITPSVTMTTSQRDHTPVLMTSSPSVSTPLKPLVTTTAVTTPIIINKSIPSVTTPLTTKNKSLSPSRVTGTTSVTNSVSPIPTATHVIRRPITQTKEFVSQPMRSMIPLSHLSDDLSSDSDSSINIPLPDPLPKSTPSRLKLPNLPTVTTTRINSNSFNTTTSSAGIISPTTLYGVSGSLQHKSTPKDSNIIQQKQQSVKYNQSIVSPCSSNNDSILSEPPTQHQHSFKKYEEVCEEKREIDKIRMDQEVEIRQLKYKMEQFEEEIQSTNEEKEKLLDQLCQSEKRISKELQEKQSLELNCKEIEIQNKTIMVTLQQTREELDKVKSLLISEREDNNLKSTALTQQQQLYESLKIETAKRTEQYGKVSEQLVTGDVTQKSLETTISELESELTSINQKLTHALNDKMNLLADIELAEQKTIQAENILRQEKDHAVSKTHERHTLELRVQELEINKESLTATKEQLRVELQDTKTLLREEQEMRSHKDTELNNKSELYKTLQEEIRKVIEEKAKLSAMLEKVGETKGTLESKICSLEGQLSSANGRLANELSTKMQLMKDIGDVERKAEERKYFIEEEKMKHHMVVESLKADIKKVESDCTAKLDQIMSLKETIASNNTTNAVMERDIQNMKKELVSSTDHNTQLQERINTIEQSYDQLDREKDNLEQIINQLSQEMSSKVHELEETQKVARKYQEVVEKAQETLTNTARERDELLAERAGLQSQIIDFDGKMNNILIELNQFDQKEKNYHQEVHQLKKSRSSLQELATKLRSDNISLEHKLTDEVIQKERAQSENGELKEIWECEVKAKHKLTDRLMELELIQKDTDGSVNQEKRKIKKIIEQKEIMQMKIDALQEKNGQLQRENGQYKISLKESKKRLRMIETRHFEEMNNSRLTDKNECIPLHKKITKLQEQLKLECDHKFSAQDQIRVMEHELQMTKRMLEETRNELSQVTRRNKTEERKIISLTEELNTLQDHLSQLTVPKDQYNEINSELKESNFENMKMSKDMSDARQKLKSVLKDVNQLKSDNAMAVADAIKYKDLYEKEMGKRENLAARLDKTRSKMAYSKSRLDMERLETERLLEETRRNYHQKSSMIQSTPKNNYDDSRSSSPIDNDLVYEVRSRLDRSIADHRDSTLTFSMLGKNSYRAETENNLDSIRRQYRL